MERQRVEARVGAAELWIWGLRPGHFGLYWVLCEERFGRQATVERLQELAVAEVAALTGDLAGPDQVRMHSVGVALVS